MPGTPVMPTCCVSVSTGVPANDRPADGGNRPAGAFPATTGTSTAFELTTMNMSNMSASEPACTVRAAGLAPAVAWAHTILLRQHDHPDVQLFRFHPWHWPLRLALVKPLTGAGAPVE